MRAFIQVSAMVLWLFLAFLTMYQLFTNGFDILVGLSLLVVGIIGFGIFGALSEPPRGGGPL